MNSAEKVHEQRGDVTLRIHRAAYELLNEVARWERRPLTRYLDDLAAREHRRLQWEQFREAAAQVQRDPVAREEEHSYDCELEGTLADGLEPTEPRATWEAIFAAMDDGRPEQTSAMQRQGKRRA